MRWYNLIRINPWNLKLVNWIQRIPRSVHDHWRETDRGTARSLSPHKRFISQAIYKIANVPWAPENEPKSGLGVEAWVNFDKCFVTLSFGILFTLDCDIYIFPRFPSNPDYVPSLKKVETFPAIEHVTEVDFCSNLKLFIKMKPK